MKYVRAIALKMILSCAFVLMLGCEDETPPLTLEQQVEQALAVIEKNESILDDVVIDGRLITSSAEYNIRAKQVQDRDQFIGKMIEDTELIYAELAFAGARVHKVIVDPAPVELLRNYLKLFPTGYTGANGGGLTDMLRQETATRLNRHADNEKYILLNDWSFNSGIGSQRPTEVLTLNFEVIERIHVELEHKLITNFAISANSGSEIMETLGLTTPAEKLFVGLLLPSISSCREDRASYNKLINDTFDFTSEQRKQFDHDVRIVTYEIALQYMISEDYHNKNEHEASLEINRRVCNAMMAMVAAIGYDLYK